MKDVYIPTVVRLNTNIKPWNRFRKQLEEKNECTITKITTKTQRPFGRSF